MGGRRIWRKGQRRGQYMYYYFFGLASLLSPLSSLLSLFYSLSFSRSFTSHCSYGTYQAYASSASTERIHGRHLEGCRCSARRCWEGKSASWKGRAIRCPWAADSPFAGLSISPTGMKKGQPVGWRIRIRAGRQAAYPSLGTADSSLPLSRFSHQTFHLQIEKGVRAPLV
ncbi:hypothetical protein EJ06DRAFT_256080 [Trichodelitschia bisporula]|uniref:Uncharacterized protein n=1 Tax=Trichodelitschia bisporula TaxID=703511 RepID=A0A6G1HIV5_9PEZI|nr:hypothetical protein EJ06DRAFT_256080 [Trichodelitschia bisporula]